MTTDGDPGPIATGTAGPGARGLTGVGVASLVAAGAGYVVLLLAARVLDTEANADFLGYWGLLFFVLGALGGLQSEVTRAVHAARETPHRDVVAAGRVRTLPLGLGVGAALAAAVTLTSPWWAPRVLPGNTVVGVVLVCVAAVAFAGHASVAGALAGSGRWTWFARLVGAESLLRLALAAGAVLLATALPDALPLGLWVAAAGGTAAWLALGASPAVRAAGRERADAPARVTWGRVLQAMAGAASSAALVVGFPVLLRLTTDDAAYRAAAPLLLAVQLTRAPLLLPLGAYQGVAITHVLRHRDQGLRPLLRPAGLVAGIGVLGAGLAVLVGPWLMATVLGEDYRVAGPVLGALTLAAVGMALLTLTGAASLALGAHRWYAAGWLVATVGTAAALVLAPWDTAVRTVVSLAIGPVLGVLVHLAGMPGPRLGRR